VDVESGSEFAISRGESTCSGSRSMSNRVQIGPRTALTSSQAMCSRLTLTSLVNNVIS